MQTLESLGVPASAFLIPHSMPEAPNNGQQGWVHPQQQGFPSPMDQGGLNPNAHPNHIFVMNNVKPEQPIQRREEVISSPPPNPSVITATYNPTYNRCLPKILSDLDCEMKIKQVLRCIENILLETGDVDLQQQAYKLPDRSLSPQFAKTKKPKFKEDEEMLQSPNPSSINLPLASNSPASLINKAANKNNNIKINVKVEPDLEQKVAISPGVRPVYNEQATGSPRGQMFDFSYKQSPGHPGQQQQQQQFPPQSSMGSQRQFPYDNFPNSPHIPQPMIPHIQLSMSSPHLSHSAAANSPHLQHLQASSPHIHSSPHMHSPLQHTHTNSPHLVHSPLPHSPHGHAQPPSPHVPSPNGVLSPQQPIPIQQFQVLTRPEGSESGHHSSDSIMQQDYHFQQMEGVQAGGFKSENPHPQQQAQQKKEPIDFVLDPSLFAQYLAQNQQQLAQLQQQLHQQQIQHSQLQQQRYHLQQQQSHNSPQQHTQQQPSQQHQQPQQQAHNNAHPNTTTTAPPQAPQQVPPHLQHLFDPTHPINLSGHHPMSLSGHLMQQLGPDGTINLQEDDKWILSLLNMDSSIAHDLSLSGHIPPM